jgi:hypothetical protein
VVSRAVFDELFQLAGVLGDQLFNVFDTDHNGSVNPSIYLSFHPYSSI